MPLEFLREIETGTLPRQVTETGDIDLLRLLSAAGMVEADLPDVEGSGTATVRRIVNMTALTAASMNDFLRRIEERDPNQPEFLQAVREVMVSLWPFVEKNPQYREYGLLERIRTERAAQGTAKPARGRKPKEQPSA